jgi:PD-(D/E)XK endonuclease
MHFTVQAHFDIPDSQAVVPILTSWARLSSANKGLVGEVEATAWLIGRGFDVWRPAASGHRADLAILARRRPIRLQVKVARYIAANDVYRVSFRRLRKRRPVPYRAAEIDFILVVIPGLPRVTVYVIPVRVFVARATATLAPHRSRPRRHGARNWETYREADHLLRRHARRR